MQSPLSISPLPLPLPLPLPSSSPLHLLLHLPIIIPRILLYSVIYLTPLPHHNEHETQFFIFLFLLFPHIFIISLILYIYLCIYFILFYFCSCINDATCSNSTAQTCVANNKLGTLGSSCTSNDYCVSFLPYSLSRPLCTPNIYYSFSCFVVPLIPNSGLR